MRQVHDRVERALGELLALEDEADLDPRWSLALDAVRAYALRPAKRVRPALVLVGYGIGRPGARAPKALWRFAAALELLHTFLLVHDDVADGAETRRGGAALHRMLGAGRRGEDLAVVVGDHLFARAIEGMLASGLPRALEAVRYWLGVCRSTAVGQYLDLDLTGARLGDVTLFETLQVAMLKTARYSVVAPLVSGTLLAGAAEPTTLRLLERMGRQLGIAFQIRDDLLGLYGRPERTGKPAEVDLQAGKPTFPVVAAYLRAPHAARAELDHLWEAARREPGARGRLCERVAEYGGRAAAERAVTRATRAARRTLAALSAPPRCHAMLNELIDELADRPG